MKRIYLFILILVSLNAGAQTVPAYFSPIASPYDYQWLRARYLRIPTAAQTGADAGSIYYNATDSSVKVWTGYNYINVGIAGGGGSSYFAGYGLNLSGTTFKADTLALSTRLWRNKGLDSLAAVIGTNYYNKAASDGRYALLGHTHTASQITDFTTVGRNLYTGGTGIDVNNTTGVISFTGGGSGTYLFSAPLNESGGTVSITQANGSTNGYLSAVDWTLFNGKVSQDALDDTANALRALIAAATPDSFTYATRRYVDSSVSALSGDFILNSTTQQTANFNITGNGVMGGNLDVTGSGNFAQNRVQHYHATAGGASRWYNTSGDEYAQVNPDQGGFVSSRRVEFNSAVGDPTVGTNYKGYIYMKSGVPYWSYNGTHTAIPLGGGGASTTSDLTDVSDAAPANNTVLTYNQDSAKYVPTAVAAYNFTALRDGQYLSYDSLNNQWVNVDAPTTGNGGSIARLASQPTDGTLIYFNTTSHKLGILNDEETYYLYFTPSDSLPVTGGGGASNNFTLESGHNATLSTTTVSRTSGSGDWDTFVNTGEQLATTGDYLVFYADWGAQVNVGIANNNALTTSGANGCIPGMDASLTLASDGNLYRDPAVNFADVGDWSAGLWIKILRASDTVIEYYRSTDGTTWGSPITTSTISSTNAGHVYASPHTGTIQNFTHN